MKNTDTGPTMPPPDDRKSAHARAVLMAQVRQTPLEPTASTADVATFGRSELDDAPREIKKRWLAAGAGLAAAAVGAAIVLGSGPFGDDLGVTPAEDPNTDTAVATDAVDSLLVAEGCLFGANESLESSLESLTDESNPMIAEDLNAAIDAGPLEVAYEHVEAEYTAAVVQNMAYRRVCFGDDEGPLSRGGHFGPTVGTPDVVTLQQRFHEPYEGSVHTLVVGQVAEDVESILVRAADGGEAQAHRDGGFFSARLAADDNEALTFEVTMTDGSVEVIDAQNDETSATTQ